MADTKIRFSIGAVFSGEGFQKANDAIKDTANKSKEAAGRLGALAAQASLGDSKLSKLAGMAGQVASAFATMGVAGGALAIFNIGLEKWRQNLDEAAKAAKEAADAQEKMLHDAVTKKLSAVSNMLAKVREEAGFAAKAFEQIAAAQNKLADARASSSSASGSTALAQMAWNAMQEMLKAEDDASKKLVEAKWRLAIETEKASKSNADAQAAIESASRELAAAQAKQARADQTLAAAAEARAQAEKELAEVSFLRESERKRFEDQLKNAKEAEKQASLAATLAKTETQIAEEKLKQTTEKAEQTRISGITAVAELADQEKKLKDAAAKEEAARLAAAERARRNAELEADASYKEDFVQDVANKQLEILDKLIQACDEEIESIREVRKAAQDGMLADAQHTNGSFGQYVYTLDRNGNIVDFEDFRRSLRFNERAARDVGNIDKRNARLAKEMEKIRAQGKNALPSAKKRLDDWDKFRKQAEGEIDAQKRKEQLEKQKDALMKRLDENVKAIHDDLKQAIEVA